MDYLVLLYGCYLVLSIGLTIWVATTLSRKGVVFLRDIFGDEQLAQAVNHLLVVGFYLINLGFVTFTMRTDRAVDSVAMVLELLSRKVGTVLLVLGALHFLNVLVLSRYRRSRKELEPVPRLPASRVLAASDPGGRLTLDSAADPVEHG